jgi:Putative MetA-pathway of phenol degradation
VTVDCAGRMRNLPIRGATLRLAVLSWLCLTLALGTITPVLAGPPYMTDDPEPTDYQHFEVYTFMNGTATSDGTSGESGIDFNYGGAPNLQLTATVPASYNAPSSGPSAWSFGNVELAAKYRFLTQENFGLDVAIFPRLFLPSASSAVGEQHASFLLPVWMEKDWGQWSAFGGGGCEINRGGGSENFCLMGAVVTRQITPRLQVGLELFHQTPDTEGGDATTSIGAGVRYDLNDNLHLLGYLGRGIQNVDATDRYNWYTSILFTF